MLEIICLGALALTTNVCTSTAADLAIHNANAIELDTILTEVHVAGRPYESDYSREAERIEQRHNSHNYGNSRSRRSRIYQNLDRRTGGCVDERGRVHRNPDQECSRENLDIYRDSERRNEYRDRIYREPSHR